MPPELWSILKEYDIESYNKLRQMFSEQEGIEKSVISRAPSYNQGLLDAAKEHLNFLNGIEQFFTFDQNAYDAWLNKTSAQEFEVEIAKKRLTEQNARAAARQTKTPSQILYQKLEHEFNQFQLGLQTLDQASSAMQNISVGIDENDLELINVRDNFLSKVKYVGEATEKDNTRKINNLETSLYRKVQFYRAGMLPVGDYLKYLNDLSSQGKQAKESGAMDDYSNTQREAGQAADLLIDNLQKAKQKKIDKAHDEELKSELRVSSAKIGIITDEEQKKLAEIEYGYQRKKTVIDLEVKDESEKAKLISQLNTALQHELAEQRLKNSIEFQSFLAVSKSAFGSLWDNIIIGQRRAKDEWDQLWLDMKNSALRRIEELLQNELTKYLFNLFIDLGFGDVGSFLGLTGSGSASSPVSPFNDFAGPVYGGGLQTAKLIERLDNLEAAIVNKSWSIKGEDIYSVNNMVENRRASNAL